MFLIQKLQKHGFALQHDRYSVLLRRRVTEVTKKESSAQQQDLPEPMIPQQLCESWQVNCVSRLSLGLSTQIMEIEYNQACKMIETGVLVWKSNNLKPKQPFFHFGIKMPKAKWWTNVSDGFSYIECQIMPRVDAGKWAKKMRRPALHDFIKHCGTKSTRTAPPNTLTDWYTRFLQKPTHFSILWLGQPNPNDILPKYTVLIHCWVVRWIILCHPKAQIKINLTKLQRDNLKAK